MLTLQPNSSLQGGKYKILQSLGQGGFGITYLAIQSGLERKVAIKEFFMKDYCNRDEATSHVSIGSQGSVEMVNRYREKFLKEARNIARLDHPNIVKVIDVFEENGTAYYVMQYAACGSLSDRVKKEGYLSEPVATRYILQIADALDYIHQQKMNHLDVKPANIMLNEKDETVLIDFGLAKQYDTKTGNQTSSTPVGISEGYAPLEQYRPGGVGEFSPESDVYALGATYYKLLTGITPPNASDVNEDGLPIGELKAKGVSQAAINAISAAMEPRKKVRTKSARDFMELLEADVTEDVDVEVDVEDEETQKFSAVQNVSDKSKDVIKKESLEPKSTKWLWIALAVILFVVIVLAFKGGGGKGAAPLSDSLESMKEDTIDAVQTFTANGVSFDMILVKAGTFTMGATAEEDNLDYSYNKPAHQVTLTKDYYIAKTEVTQALWQAVMGNNPSEYQGDNKPVEQVTWNDCQKFVEKLNAITGKNFRLPTEAEWEFAARGGNNSQHYIYSGSNNLNEVAWYSDNSGDRKPAKNETLDVVHCQTQDVATKQPNELGIFDMIGNVDEWCSDRFSYYSNVAQTDPNGANSGQDRVSRGGCWASDGRYCCSSVRTFFEPDYTDSTHGFRLALSE